MAAPRFARPAQRPDEGSAAGTIRLTSVGRGSRHRGMALLLVLVVVGTAAVIGYSVLSSSALQARIGQNAAGGYSAQYLAESGLNIALFELEQSGSGAVWSQTGIVLPNVPGTVDIAVTQGTDPTLYAITSTAHLPDAGGGTLTHRAQAVVRINNVAAIFRDNIAIKSGVAVQGAISTSNDGQGGGVLGALLGVVDGVINLFIPDNLIPKVADATGLLSGVSTKSYTYQGTVYQAQQVSTNLTGQQLGPSASNPLGIFYTTNTTTVSDTHINGSLFVMSGMLIINGDTTITSQNLNADNTGSGMLFTSFPALVVQSSIQLRGRWSTVRVNGSSWLQNGITKVFSSTGVSLIFNGPLTIGGSSASVTPTSQGPIIMRPGVQLVSWTGTVAN